MGALCYTVTSVMLHGVDGIILGKPVRTAMPTGCQTLPELKGCTAASGSVHPQLSWIKSEQHDLVLILTASCVKRAGTSTRSSSPPEWVQKKRQISERLPCYFEERIGLPGQVHGI